jgi:hypothetical protein
MAPSTNTNAVLLHPTCTIDISVIAAPVISVPAASATPMRAGRLSRRTASSRQIPIPMSGSTR